MILKDVFTSTVAAAVHILPLAVKFPKVIVVITVAPLRVTVPLNVFPHAKVCVPVFTNPRENTQASGRLKV